ncbi:hypothetical protein [Aliarcobacter cryaerophilus]|uniref:hypothetical protein n=1 Tax=Aliarcobacter cryaerophilus TaxID=28198 RepID=UPI00215B71C3|nr:hypothetical protein [Aliarcobacter cryaerophilus]
MHKNLGLGNCVSSDFLDYTNLDSVVNSKIDKKIEIYFEIFEILILSNNIKNAQEILEILKNLVDFHYIQKDIFNDFLRSGEFLKYIKKYLPHSQINITNIEDYFLN